MSENINLVSSKHPHEPEIAPIFDTEGRCLVCSRLHHLEVIATLEAKLAAVETQTAEMRIFFDDVLRSSFDEDYIFERAKYFLESTTLGQATVERMERLEERNQQMERLLEQEHTAALSDSPPTEMVSGKLKIVTICGSSRFVSECAVKAWELNKQGIATFFMPTLPMWYPGIQEHHQAEHEGVAENLDNLWLRLIEMSDEVFIMNCGGYIGERTGIERDHAIKFGIPVKYEQAITQPQKA